jgi:ferritin
MKLKSKGADMSEMEEDLLASFSQQIKNELGAAYYYLAASAYLDTANLSGMAAWMRHQSHEEVEHAFRFIRFLTDRGIRPTFQTVDQPDSSFGSPLDSFERAYEQEKRVTDLIHRLYEKASSKRDYAAQVMLQWFITEQVEEEKSIRSIAERLRMASKDFGALLMLDRGLASRGYQLADKKEAQVEEEAEPEAPVPATGSDGCD